MKGSQTPLRQVFDENGNEAVGDFAVRFVARYGLVLDPWQSLTFRCWLSRRADGKWAHSRCGLSVPRQNGKSALLEARALFGMVMLGEKILFTSNTGKGARTFFRRLLSFFQNEAAYPDLAGLVVSYRESIGLEAIYLSNGGSLEVIDRNKNAGRGFTVDVVMFDEAQEISDESMEALGPTTSAAPTRNRQLIFCGTPPSEGMHGDVFTRFRVQALGGRAVRVCWFEWSMPDGADLDDPNSWAAANPALGFRVGLEEISEDRSSGEYSDEGFARERGGMWAVAVTNAVIDADSWRDVGDAGSRRDGAIAFAVDISPDRSMASIAVAGARSDGLYHVEVVDSRQGTDWLLPALMRMVAEREVVAVVVDGPASSLVPELTSLRVPVYKTSMSEFGVACGLFYDSVMNRALRHPKQPLFTAAIEVARKRPLGDMWAWGRKNSASDITPVVAATLALYGFVTARPVKRKRSGGGRVLVMS